METGSHGTYLWKLGHMGLMFVETVIYVLCLWKRDHMGPVFVETASHLSRVVEKGHADLIFFKREKGHVGVVLVGLISFGQGH